MTYRYVGNQLYRDGARVELHVDHDRARTAQESPDPLARLRDAVAVYADYPGDHIVVDTAGDLSGWAAGLTVDDLRALLQRLGG